MYQLLLPLLQSHGKVLNPHCADPSLGETGENLGPKFVHDRDVD